MTERVERTSSGAVRAAPAIDGAPPVTPNVPKRGSLRLGR